MDSYLKAVDVGDRKFVLVLCSATDQWKILKLFAKYSLNGVLNSLAIGSKGMAVGALFGEFAARATDDEIDYVSDALLSQCTEVGKEEPLTLDSFHCDMFLYSELHLKALEANFGDFSKFLTFHAESQE